MQSAQKWKIQLLSSRSVFTLEKQDVKYTTDSFKNVQHVSAEKGFLQSNHLCGCACTLTSLHCSKLFGDLLSELKVDPATHLFTVSLVANLQL